MRKLLLILVILLIQIPAWADDPSIFNSILSGRKTVTSAGTAEAVSSSSTSIKRFVVCAEDSNTGVVAIGGSNVKAAESTRAGVYLYSGDCAIIPINDPSKIFVDSIVTGDGVTFNTYQ